MTKMTEGKIRENILRELIGTRAYLVTQDPRIPHIIADWIVGKAFSPQRSNIPSVQARRLFEDIQSWALGYCVMKIKNNELNKEEAAKFLHTIIAFLVQFAETEKKLKNDQIKQRAKEPRGKKEAEASDD